MEISRVRAILVRYAEYISFQDPHQVVGVGVKPISHYDCRTVTTTLTLENPNITLESVT